MDREYYMLKDLPYNLQMKFATLLIDDQTTHLYVASEKTSFDDFEAPLNNELETNVRFSIKLKQIYIFFLIFCYLN